MWGSVTAALAAAFRETRAVDGCGCIRTGLPFIAVPGLDPGIQQFGGCVRLWLDCRVAPGKCGVGMWSSVAAAPAVAFHETRAVDGCGCIRTGLPFIAVPGRDPGIQQFGGRVCLGLGCRVGPGKGGGRGRSQ